MKTLKATVLIDNIPQGELQAEWGLSIYIEYAGKKILLDTGASGKFAENAKMLQLDIRQTDVGVLSHAHYDHADGMDAFFRENSKAVFYLQKGCKENCYKKKPFPGTYIGIKKGLLDTYKERLVYVEGAYEIMEGVILLPHKEKDLSWIGKKNNLYVKKGLFLRPDDFCHEQSLIFDTNQGLVIFNSCSHGGADRIIREVKETFPQKQIYAIIGGFHLHRLPQQEVRALAERIRETGIQKVYTGHCTGTAAYEVLREELGDMVQQLRTGEVIEL